MDKLKLKELLFKLKTLSHNNDELFMEEINFLYDELESEKYKIVVMGEFSTGKSTFINAILGQKLLFSFMGEATRVVTYIEKGEDVSACIHYTDENNTIPLGKSDDYKQLESYLSKSNKDEKPLFVQITSPTFKYEGDIALIDTPGLQGLNSEDVQITKEAVESSNATIFVITKAGFSQSELDILTGKNTEFGDIKSKDIIIVINQIGEVAGNTSLNNQDEAIERIKKSVKDKLIEIGLSDLPIFAVDSRDYLWSQDNNEYELAKKNTENNSEIVYTQDFYENRSRFDTVFDFFDSFLMASNREANFIQDIYDKVLCLVEEFESIIESSENKEQLEINKQILLIESQKRLLVENRKKLYNTIVRKVSHTLETYYGSLIEENNDVSNKVIKTLARSIKDQFVTIDSFDHHIKSYNACLEKTLLDYKEVVRNGLGKYLLELQNYIVKKSWTDMFSEIFYDVSELNLKNKFTSVHLDVDWKSINKLDNDSGLSDSKRKLKEYEVELRKETSKKEKIDQKLSRVSMSDLKRELDQVESQYRLGLKQLGKRPAPTQKYKDVIVKKKFLFFKAKWETVPDGWDKSRCYEWDSKSKSLLSKYNASSKICNKKILAHNDVLSEQKAILRKISMIEEFIDMTQHDIAERENYIKRKTDEEYDAFLDEKRMQLLSLSKKNILEFILDLGNEVEGTMTQFKAVFKKELENEIAMVLENHNSRLDKKIEDFKKDLFGQYESLTYFENSIKEIRKECV